MHLQAFSLLPAGNHKERSLKWSAVHLKGLRQRWNLLTLPMTSKKGAALSYSDLSPENPNLKLRIYTISLLFLGHAPSIFRPFFGKPYGPTPSGLLKPNTRMMIWISLEPQSSDSKNATKSQQSPLDMTFANHRSSACFQHSCFCLILMNMTIKVLNCSKKWQNNNLSELKGVWRAKYIKCCCRNPWMPYLTAQWTLDLSKSKKDTSSQKDQCAIFCRLLGARNRCLSQLITPNLVSSSRNTMHFALQWPAQNLSACRSICSKSVHFDKSQNKTTVTKIHVQRRNWKHMQDQSWEPYFSIPPSTPALRPTLVFA